jgi:hypothetical protein
MLRLLLPALLIGGCDANSTGQSTDAGALDAQGTDAQVVDAQVVDAPGRNRNHPPDSRTGSARQARSSTRFQQPRDRYSTRHPVPATSR